MENRPSVQCVAQIETGEGTSNKAMTDIMGIPVKISDENYQAGRYAITESGLVLIENRGMQYGNSVEGVHVNKVTPFRLRWNEITRLTGISQEEALQLFIESRRSSEIGRTPERDKAFAEHAEMMDRAGDYR